MMRALFVLVAAVLGLTLLERTLAQRSGEGEADSIATLMDAEERARVSANVAAVKLKLPGMRETLLFARTQGEWRCLSLAQAPASTRAIQDVVDALFAARGLVVASGSDVQPYGLAPEDRTELSFHGTRVLSAEDADTLVTVHVGRGAGSGIDVGTFATIVREDKGTILALDGELARRLAPRPGTGLPSLLDPHVVPASWSTRAQGPRRIRVERLGAPAYTLEQDGELWKLVPSRGETRACHRLLARGYTLFLARIPFAAVLPKNTESGLDSPRGIVTVTPVQGDDLVLELGDVLPDGSVIVRNNDTGNVFAIEGDIVPLLFPEPDALVDPERGNPWDPYLRGR